MNNKCANTLVGWQGVIAEVPENWNLSAVSAPSESGYFRIDSPGTMSLEVKWKGNAEKADLESSLEAFLKNLKIQAKKNRTEFEYKTKARPDGTLSFTWKSDRHAHGRIWKCEMCNNVIIAQVTGDKKDNISDISSAILPTIKDHADDDWHTWALYGMAADVPPKFKLKQHKLLSGYLKLEFANGNNRLVIERWGLAETVLKNTTLKEWYLERVQNDLKSFRYETEDALIDDNAGLHIKGRVYGIVKLLKTFRMISTFRKQASDIENYAWFSKDENKIYSVQYISLLADDTADAVTRRMV
jgi:hypothetical protein